MKWADIDPDPGVDTRDYVAEGRNNAAGLAGYVAGTVSAIPTFYEAILNTPNVLRGRPTHTMPGSFNWVGQKTGLQNHPLFQIGGIGYGGAQNYVARQGIRELQWWGQHLANKRYSSIFKKVDKMPNVTEENWGEAWDAAVRKDPYLRVREAMSRVNWMARQGTRAPPIGSGSDVAVATGLGATRAHNNIERQRSQQPQPFLPHQGVIIKKPDRQGPGLPPQMPNQQLRSPFYGSNPQMSNQQLRPPFYGSNPQMPISPLRKPK